MQTVPQRGDVSERFTFFPALNSDFKCYLHPIALGINRWEIQDAKRRAICMKQRSPMNPQLRPEWIEFSRMLSITAFCVAAIASSAPSRAATITGIVETPTHFSFSFSGPGVDGDSLGAFLPPLTFWEFGIEARSRDLNAGTFNFIIQARHLSQVVWTNVGGHGTPFGSTLVNTQTIPAGALFDIFSISITVAPPLQTPFSTIWGPYSGSFSAIRTGISQPPGVPDGGAVILLMGTSLLSLFAIRRRLEVPNKADGRRGGARGSFRGNC